jgi:tetratricopeptide (TPR) repeat protein
MVLGEYNKSVDATTLLMFSANLLASNRATANDEVLRDKNRNVLIDSLVAQSRFVEAEALAQEDIKEARVSNSRALIKSLDRLAKIYKTQQKYAQAEILTKEMLGQMITLNGASSLNIVGVHCELACLALYQKKISAADAECAIINKIMRDAIAAQPPDKTSIPIRGVYSGTEQLCGDMTRLAQSYENLGPSGNPLNTPRHLRAREREWESRSRRSSTNVKPSWVNALELENNAYRYNLSEVGLNLHAVSMLEYMQRLYVKADRGQELLPLYKEALDLSSRNKIEGSFRNAEQRELEAQRITNSLKSQQEKLVTYLSDISAVLPDTASEVPVEDDLRRRHLDLVRGNREPNFRAPALRSAREQYSLEQQRAKERQLSEQAKNIRVRENTQNEFQENLENSTKHVAELKAQHPVDSVKLAMALLDLSQTYGFASNGNNSRNGLDAIARFAEAVELYKNMQSDNSLMVNDALWRHAKMLASLDIDISPPVIELIALTELRLGEAYTKYSEFSRTWYSNSAARTKVSAAEKIAIAMVNDQRKYHPSDKERIISVLGSLAHAQACINNISGQEATYAEILKESQGMPNLRTNALRNACNFYLKIGNYEKFRTLWNELVQLSVKSDEVSRTSALYDLVLASSKNVELADTLIRQCIPIYFMSNPKSINGTYSFIQAINVVAYNYAERARFAQAESLLELALTSEEKAIGLDVIGTNELRILLSRILLKHYAWCHSHNDGVQGKKALTKSQSVFNTALRYAIKFNGTNSPAVNRMLKDRVDALTKCGLTREAQTVSAF